MWLEECIYYYNYVYTVHTGMPLAQAIEILKKQCLTVKRVQLNYSNQVGHEILYR